MTEPQRPRFFDRPFLDLFRARKYVGESRRDTGLVETQLHGFETANFVAQPRRFLEFQLGGGGVRMRASNSAT